MPTLTFKKDGEDNVTIIKTMLEFLKKGPSIVLKTDDGFTSYPCHGMLTTDTISYAVADIFNIEHTRVNTILQFYPNNNYTGLASKFSVCMTEGCKITFTENDIRVEGFYDEKLNYRLSI
ncbi:MAG: hypothetical protein JWM20_564 [Patescibacteria group bacterium]|nr:hypothetical protein [Patescibacteria group bacterium]